MTQPAQMRAYGALAEAGSSQREIAALVESGVVADGCADR